MYSGGGPQTVSSNRWNQVKSKTKAKAQPMKEQVPEKKADLEEELHRVYATLVVVLLEIANKMQLMTKGPMFSARISAWVEEVDTRVCLALRL